MLPVYYTPYLICLYHFCLMSSLPTTQSASISSAPHPLCPLPLLLSPSELPVLSTPCHLSLYHFWSLSCLSATLTPEPQLLLLVFYTPYLI